MPCGKTELKPMLNPDQGFWLTKLACQAGLWSCEKLQRKRIDAGITLGDRSHQ